MDWRDATCFTASGSASLTPAGGAALVTGAVACVKLECNNVAPVTVAVLCALLPPAEHSCIRSRCASCY